MSDTLPAVVQPIDQLAAALAKAQGVMVPPKKDREVKVDSQRTGVSYTFKYATLDAVMASIRQPLSTNELALVQRLVYGENELLIVTELLHASGQRLSSTLPVRAAGSGAQALGSEISYMRRYSICALLGIVADEDDDANMKDGNSAEQKLTKPRPAAAAIKRDEAARAAAKQELDEITAPQQAAEGSQGMSVSDRAEILSQCAIDGIVLHLSHLRAATSGKREFYQQEMTSSGVRWKFVDGEILTKIGRTKDGGPVVTWLDSILKSTKLVPFCAAIVEVADSLGVEVVQ